MIFEPSSPGRTAQPGPGVGFGRAIAEAMAESLGGRAAVTSALPGGACVEAAVPVPSDPAS